MDGRILIDYLKELISKCESAVGKKDWEAVQGGLIAGRILQSEVIDKLEALSGNTVIREVDEGQFN
jgi:hypothetical protein